MSRLGTVGKVRFCIIMRLEVYGDPGGAIPNWPSSSNNGVAEASYDITISKYQKKEDGYIRPWEGPSGKATDVWFSSVGTRTGFETDAGAGGIGVFGNSILVAIAPFVHLVVRLTSGFTTDTTSSSSLLTYSIPSMVGCEHVSMQCPVGSGSEDAGGSLGHVSWHRGRNCAFKLPGTLLPFPTLLSTRLPVSNRLQRLPPALLFNDIS